MKLFKKLTHITQALLIPCCLLTSCNYLDVIPPAQADFDDTMKDEAATLSFLFTCYGYVPRCQVYDFKAYELSADEVIFPKDWDMYGQQMAWGPYLLLIIKNGRPDRRQTISTSGLPATTGSATFITSLA